MRAMRVPGRLAALLALGQRLLPYRARVGRALEDFVAAFLAERDIAAAAAAAAAATLHGAGDQRQRRKHTHDQRCQLPRHDTLSLQFIGEGTLTRIVVAFALLA